MQTLIVNFFGQPCAGKSTTATGMFSRLKKHGTDAEYVSERAKAFVWAERTKELAYQPYVWAKQGRDLEVLIGKVEVAITDSPTLLSYFYGKKFQPQYSEHFYLAVVEEFKKKNNLNIYLEPVGAYNPNGRLQTQDEAYEIGREMRQMLLDLGIEYHTYPADDEEAIFAHILEVRSTLNGN